MIHRNRSPIRSVALASMTALAGMLMTAIGAIAQEKPPGAKPAGEPQVTELIVSPRPAPVPTLRYRLLPLDSERTPGDAAPIYLRLLAVINEEARRQLEQKPTPWLATPFDRFPVAEARKFVDMWGRRFQQIEFAARRQTCNWNYTLPEEREGAIEISLPDAQELRNIWFRLLAVKARVEVAEHKNDDALRTIETGLAFSRHLAEAPFLINQLIGIATAHQMLDRVEELIAQPDAPNLYWALTALPRPLIDVRRAMETDQKMGEWVLPEITGLDRPRTEADWASLMKRLHGRMRGFENQIAQGNPAATPDGPKIPDLAEFKAVLLPEAKKSTKERLGSIDGMPDDQVILLSIAGRFAELRDDAFKPSYLPFPEALPLYTHSDAQLKAVEGGPLGVLASLLPREVIMRTHTSQIRLDRRIATLRIVEALRMHAHANGGELPKSLGLAKIVPIPLDPAVASAFDYQREGEAAILVGSALSSSSPGFSYRITLRK